MALRLSGDRMKEIGELVKDFDDAE